jgi:hypothetical protein
MAESINQRLNAAPISAAQAREIKAVLGAVLVDLAALTASVNQLITDYNANATIATDTTAAAVTLTTTA